MVAVNLNLCAEYVPSALTAFSVIAIQQERRRVKVRVAVVVTSCVWPRFRSCLGLVRVEFYFFTQTRPGLLYNTSRFDHTTSSLIPTSHDRLVLFTNFYDYISAMVSARNYSHLTDHVSPALVRQGAIVSTIGGAINAVVSAIASIIMIIVSVIVTVSIALSSHFTSSAGY